MKRGLVILDEADVSSEDREARVDAVRAALVEGELDAALIYASVFRSDDVAYLTNLTIYWNESLLVVPREGPLVFLTKLSPRTHPWMKAVSSLTDLRSGKDLTTLLGSVAEELGLRKVGLVDDAWWPASLRDSVSNWAETEPVSLPGLISCARLVAEPSERGVLQRAVGVVHRAIASADTGAIDVQGVLGAIELSARRDGATDVIGYADRVSPEHLAVHAAVQYRGVWAEHGTIFGHGPWPPWLALSRRALDSALRHAVPGATEAGLEDHVRGVLEGDGAVSVAWEFRFTPHAEIGTRGDLRADGARPLSRGSVGAIALEVSTAMGCALLAETVEITGEGAQHLASQHDGSNR